MTLLTPLLAAFGPTALYTLVLWWLDRYEKEPLHLLIVTFIWGAAPALLLAIFFEFAFDTTASSVFGPNAPATIVAPAVEELLKALVLIGLFTFARREFNGVLDGIIYGALVGFGFAMSENILYFMHYNDQLVSLWLLRSIIFGFNHAFFTSIVGIAFGLIRFERRRWLGYVAVPVALWLAMLIHSFHNSSTQQGLLGLAFAMLVNSGGLIVIFATIVLSQRQELHWINTELDEEVARGTITLDQFERILHPALRSQLELRTLIKHGWLRFRRLRRLHHLLTELAFVKYQLRRGDRFCCPDDIVALRTAIHAVRQTLEHPPT